MQKHRMIQEFIELVSIDSSSKNERSVADKLILKLKELGLTVFEDDAGKKLGGNTGNIIGLLKGKRPGSILKIDLGL